MPEISQHYTVNLMTLSPLHIGTGRRLMRDYDYVVYRDRTWRIDQDALLDAAMGENDALDEALLDRPAAELLQPGDFKPDSSLFRYVARGAPRSKDKGANLYEQIKDAWDRPYLPGSSLKGALRTVILDWALAQDPRALDPRRLENGPRRAAQAIERSVLGPSPNDDLLRALHVSDSRPLKANATLAIENAQVLTGGQPGSPIEVEAIRAKVQLRAKVKLDLALFNPQVEQRLRLGRHREWLTDLMALSRARVTPILLQERDWFHTRYSGSAAARFYDSLYQGIQKLPDERTFLQIGWGGGWSSKTIGNRLSERDREDVILRYGLARGKRRSGDPFPKSRRVVLDQQGQPAASLGWLLIEFKEETNP